MTGKQMRLGLPSRKDDAAKIAAWRETRNPLLKANPKGGPPIAHPSKTLKKHNKTSRFCAVDGKPAGPAHHKVPKSHFHIAKEKYHEWIILPATGEQIEMDGLDNLGDLCPDCHQQWHLAFGPAFPIGLTQTAKQARMRGLKEWAKYIDTKTTRKRMHADIIHDTVPDWVSLEWMNLQVAKEEE